MDFNGWITNFTVMPISRQTKTLEKKQSLIDLNAKSEKYVKPALKLSMQVSISERKLLTMDKSPKSEPKHIYSSFIKDKSHESSLQRGKKSVFNITD